MNVLGLTVGEAATLGTLVVALVGGYFRLQFLSSQNAKDAAEALRVAREARDEGQQIKLDIAENYASVAHLKEVEARLATAIDRLTDRIDKLLSSLNA